jgi:hypothetical protein
MGRVRLFHDIKVWDGRFNDLNKNSCPTNSFWSLLEAYDQINYQQISASNQNIKIFLKNYLCIWSIAKFDSAKGHSNQFWLLCTTLVSHFGQLL